VGVSFERKRGDSKMGGRHREQRKWEAGPELVGENHRPKEGCGSHVRKKGGTDLGVGGGIGLSDRRKTQVTD